MGCQLGMRIIRAANRFVVIVLKDTLTLTKHQPTQNWFKNCTWFLHRAQHKLFPKVFWTMILITEVPVALYIDIWEWTTCLWIQVVQAASQIRFDMRTTFNVEHYFYVFFAVYDLYYLLHITHLVKWLLSFEWSVVILKVFGVNTLHFEWKFAYLNEYIYLSPTYFQIIISQVSPGLVCINLSGLFTHRKRTIFTALHSGRYKIKITGT